MAHWTITLQSAWYISDANTRRWVTPDNSRPQVPAALLESGTTSYLRVVNLRDNGRLFLNFGTGQTGEDRADLSNQFESTGQIRIDICRAPAGALQISDLSGWQFFYCQPSGCEYHSYRSGCVWVYLFWK